MLRISRVHIDYQKNPVGIAEMPQFGWEIAPHSTRSYPD